MLKAILAFGALGLMGLPAAADVRKEDLKKLAAAGVSEEVILSYVKTNGPVVKLSADDLVELKQAGLTEKVLEVAAAGGSPAPAPSQSRVEVQESRIYEPSTTYVYPTPSHSYGYRPFDYYRHYGVYSPHYSYGGHYPGFFNHSPVRAHHGAFHHGGAHHGGAHHRGGHHGGGHHR